MLNVNIVKIRVKFLYVPLPGPMSAPKSKNCGRFETPRPPRTYREQKSAWKSVIQKRYVRFRKNKISQKHRAKMAAVPVRETKGNAP